MKKWIQLQLFLISDGLVQCRKQWCHEHFCKILPALPQTFLEYLPAWYLQLLILVQYVNNKVYFST